MIAQALPDLVPKVLLYDRRLLAFVNLALMGDPPDVDVYGAFANERGDCRTVTWG